MGAASLFWWWRQGLELLTPCSTLCTRSQVFPALLDGPKEGLLSLIRYWPSCRTTWTMRSAWWWWSGGEREVAEGRSSSLPKLVLLYAERICNCSEAGALEQESAPPPTSDKQPLHTPSSISITCALIHKSQQNVTSLGCLFYKTTMFPGELELIC